MLKVICEETVRHENGNRTARMRAAPQDVADQSKFWQVTPAKTSVDMVFYLREHGFVEGSTYYIDPQQSESGTWSLAAKDQRNGPGYVKLASLRDVDRTAPDPTSGEACYEIHWANAEADFGDPGAIAWDLTFYEADKTTEVVAIVRTGISHYGAVGFRSIGESPGGQFFPPGPYTIGAYDSGYAYSYIHVSGTNPAFSVDSETGVCTFLATGTGYVRVTGVDSGLVFDHRLTVISSAITVLCWEPHQLQVGGLTQTLAAWASYTGDTTVTWSSDNNSICTVVSANKEGGETAAGEITAVSEGVTYIRATGDQSGKVGTYRVEVKAAA